MYFPMFKEKKNHKFEDSKEGQNIIQNVEVLII